ncbi:hypothetical protein [Microvirga aerophila]|uniref:PD-(D/E)XK endonuclease-like domain-containing protein n=1 Tax=Microvirga aerophila TaxID=670291 RepID=A0A512BL32_9HYPH|nr:hypothetical protein [Microvirga aerophila]GEO12625.1 hypothetical protein MAE02_03210 [Microvirga aerophila]
MKFYPTSLYDANAGEDAVWTALQVGLEAVLGGAYYRLPITGSDGFTRYEPDILLVLPFRRLLILECKGCRIANIDAINGSVWQMAGWYRTQEQPHSQARTQMFALKDMLRDRGIAGMPVEYLVALPFVSRKEWQERFGGLAAGDSILFTEDLAPEALIRRIEAIQTHDMVDEASWGRLSEVLGSSDRWSSGGARVQGSPTVNPDDRTAIARRVTILRYTGTPPSAQQLCSTIGIGLEAPYTYLVATAALERRRSAEALGGQHQVRKNLRSDAEQTEEVQLLFSKALRHFISRPILSRSEERVLIRRAIREVAEHDAYAAEQLRHDVFAWRDVLAELEEAGIDLAVSSGSTNHDWADPALRDLAVRLQASFRRQRQNAGRRRETFEGAARHYLDHVYEPTPTVVMEGFTRLTPLQRHFIWRCAEKGARVWVVQPYRSEQSRGFAALDDTYKDFLNGATILDIRTDPVGQGNMLVQLQQGLFSNQVPAGANPSNGSVRVDRFEHRNDEVAACVERILAALSDPDDSRLPKDIAVVCSDPQGTVPLLREEAEVRGKPDLFSVPPRQLLLTPVGRFALTLYEVWESDGLDLDAEQFATLLASGWLGAAAQRSIEPFTAIAAQQFLSCRTARDWLEAFGRLELQRKAGPGLLGSLYARLPSSLIEDTHLRLWRETIHTVVRLCRKLFQSGEKPIGDHIALLLDEIERLDPDRILLAEREVLTSIRDAFADLASANSVLMDAGEFGQVLNGLIRERADGTGISDGELPGSQAGKQPDRIWVVGPEGIDNVTCHTVFFLGLDDRNMPASGGPRWPRAEWNLEEHIKRERYRFLAVLRAAEHRLYLSYAGRDWEQTYRASLYLDMVGSFVRTNVVAPRPSPPSQEVVTADLPARHHISVHRSRYDIAEIAIFKLCPYRFKLEALTNWARCYSNSWQLAWIARGVWIAEIFAHVHAVAPGRHAPIEMSELLQTAVAATKCAVVDRFRGLHPLTWISVERDVRQSVVWLANKMIQRGAECGITSSTNSFSKELSIDSERTVIIEASADFLELRGTWANPLWETNRRAVWLQYGRRDVGIPAQQGELSLFTRLYDAVSWWGDMSFHLSRTAKMEVSKADELREAVRHIQAGAFPKNPGDHCRYCPVHDTCMGLLP